ncbi:hypothetical protein MTsPCn9_10310 [Croceitalea sp. MTPC9]|uniref:LA2681 family HEPN domain-containing protein n=1 Tax=unclassified Croceitalea TaxID=2632280 RepID=UPI002B3ECB81|nr:hypothetical protein MTsPCn6_26930 [Croceitalea sp. MTPC6]GMN16095.1 hypothetical protein MTsPCn9_10310 [Croceitalea sp. MTPC9]
MNIRDPKVLMKLQTFKGIDPEDIVISLQTLFESGRGMKDSDYIEKGLALGKDVNFEDFYVEQLQAFHFNMANGWSYLHEHRQVQTNLEIGDFQPKELEQQIFHLRMALSVSQYWHDPQRKCEVLTNLGILFNTIGRFSEALQYYRRAFEIIPEFGQTMASYAHTILGYSRFLYDGAQQGYFFKMAYEAFGKALEGELYAETRTSVIEIRGNIESLFPNDELGHDYGEGSFDLGNGPEEVVYRKWVLNNGLFLNPINDLSKESIAAHDCLLLPTLKAEDNRPEFHQMQFNQMKQEFVSARYIYYEGLVHAKPHFSDKGNLQMDLSKGINYGMAVEKLKICFRMNYSILDKLAYLLNDYMELGWPTKSVSFSRIWYKPKTRDRTEVMDKVNATENLPFRGLFWLNKDFYDKDLPNIISIAPESKAMAEIRNYLEHKSLNIISNEEWDKVKDDSGNSYWIKRQDFVEKTLNLMHAVRAGLIYLSLGVNLEESKKPNNGPTIPIYPNIKDDSQKF